MSDSNVDITGAFGPQKLLKIIDVGTDVNGQQEYAVATSDQGSVTDGIAYDTILITYTDGTKATISKVEWKLAGDVVKTLTPTFAATTDTWVKS